MDRTRNRWMVRLVVVIIVGSAMLLWGVRQQAQSVLTISNQSGQTIAELKVTTDEGNTITFRDIAADTEETVPFVTRGDERFRLEVKLANGRITRWQGPADHLKVLIDPGGNIKVPTGRKN